MLPQDMFVCSWIDDQGRVKTAQKKDFLNGDWFGVQTIASTSTNLGPVLGNSDLNWRLLWLNDGHLQTTSSQSFDNNQQVSWRTAEAVKLNGRLVPSEIKPALAFDENNQEWVVLFQDPRDFKVGRMGLSGWNIRNVQASNFTQVRSQPRISDISMVYFNGKFHIAFDSEVNNIEGVWYANSLDAASWSKPVLVQQNSTGKSFYHPVIKVYLSALYIGMIDATYTGSLVGQTVSIYRSGNIGVSWFKIGSIPGNFAPNSDEIGMAVGNIGPNFGCDLLVIAPTGASGTRLDVYESSDDSACNMSNINFGATYQYSAGLNLGATGPSIEWYNN